jgi:hypothetical protein
MQAQSFSETPVGDGSTNLYGASVRPPVIRSVRRTYSEATLNLPTNSPMLIDVAREPGLIDAGRSYDVVSRLCPICRSITGDGVATLKLLREVIPRITSSTGTGVFDWTVPKEWNIRGLHRGRRQQSRD